MTHPGVHRRALLVSWLFPPHGSIGAKRAYRFARHLPPFGWDATVLCGRAPPARMRDPSPWTVPPGVTVVPDYDPLWLTTLANRLDHAAQHAATPTLEPRASTLADRVSHWISRALPTETIAIHLPHATQAARTIARTQPHAAVWTTSYPYSSHAIGMALKREFGLPFVADLRDPWTLNFVHDQKFALTRRVERRFERAVFEAADRVTLTTETLADAYRAMFPQHAHKFTVVRNAFDPMPLAPRAEPTSPVRAIHFGHVYGERTLAPVLQALGSLRRAGTLPEGKLRLENYGRLSRADRAIIAAEAIGPFVVQNDPIPYADGIARLRAAHLLLLPAWGTDRGRLFLPGKLYDYLLAGAPIVAIGDNPELASILERTGTGWTFAPDDVAGLSRLFASALSGTLPPRVIDHEAVAEFSAPNAARTLAGVLDQIAR